MSHDNNSPGEPRERADRAITMLRLLNDVAFHANLVALRATVLAVRASRERSTRRLSSAAGLNPVDPQTLQLVAEIDQATAALYEGVAGIRGAVAQIESLAERAQSLQSDVVSSGGRCDGKEGKK